MNAPDPTRRELSGADLDGMLRRHWRAAAVTFVVVFAAVAAATFAMPKQYEARLEVLVNNERIDEVVSPEGIVAPARPGEVSDAQINSEIELLTSDGLLRQVVIQCGLDKARPAADSSLAVAQALRRLKRDLSVSAVRRSDVILAEYDDENARRAAAVLTALSQLYLEEHLRVHSVPGSYAFFNAQAERLRLQLSDADSELADFRHREHIDVLVEQKDLTLQKATESESLAFQAEAAMDEGATKAADLRRQIDAADPRVLTQSHVLSNQYSIERLNTMLADLQNRRSELLIKYRPDDRLVQETDKEVADTKAALASAAKSTAIDQATDINPLHQALEIDLARQEAELAGLESRRAVLARQAQTYRSRLARLGDDTAAFEDLERKQKDAEDNYELYAKKAEEARIEDSLNQKKISNVAIAEAPVEPRLPAKPNIALNLALGVALAGCCGLAAGVAGEYFGGNRGKEGAPSETAGAA